MLQSKLQPSSLHFAIASPNKESMLGSSFENLNVESFPVESIRKATCDANEVVNSLLVISKNVKCLETVEETVKTLKRKFEELEQNMEKIRMKFRKLEEIRLEVQSSDTGINLSTKEMIPFVKLEVVDLEEEEKVFEIKRDHSVVMDLRSLRGSMLINTEQFLIFVKQEKWMFEVLCKFCNLLNTRIIIFCRAKLGAMHLALNMGEKGYPVKALCGDLSKKKRIKIVNDALKGTVKIITLTGSLDVEGLQELVQNSVVIIYNMPQTWESISKLFGIEVSKWRGLAIYSCLEKNSHYFNRFKHLSEEEVCRMIQNIHCSEDKYCLFHV